MRRWITHLSLLALLVAGIFSVTAPAMAQDTEVVRVAVVLCTDATCDELGERVPDITITAVDTTTNETLGSCTTASANQTGGCGFSIPTGAEYSLSWSTTPAGYTYFGSNFRVDDGPASGLTFIPFIPDQAPDRYNINVNAALCTDATCSEFGDFLIDFEIQALHAVTSEPLASCATSNQAQHLGCALSIPTGADYYLSWFPAAVPAGYEFHSVITSGGQMGPVVSTIAFSPSQEPVGEAINVNAALCTDATCSELGDFLIDFEIRAYDNTNNDLLDTCYTSNQAQHLGCVLYVPTGTPFFMGWDNALVPDGYEFHGVIVSDGQMGPVVRTLTFAPTSQHEFVQVRAALCTDATCSDLGDFLYDFEIIAYDDDTNERIASCFTALQSQTGGCALSIPAGVDYYLGWNPDAHPAGYEFYDIIVSDGQMGPVVYTLAFAPETPGTKTPTPTKTPEPTKTPTKAPATSTAVSGLPSTGATGGDGGSTASLLALATGLLAASALAVGSRRIVRHDR